MVGIRELPPWWLGWEYQTHSREVRVQKKDLMDFVTSFEETATPTGVTTSRPPRDRPVFGNLLLWWGIDLKHVKESEESDVKGLGSNLTDSQGRTICVEWEMCCISNYLLWSSTIYM